MNKELRQEINSKRLNTLKSTKISTNGSINLSRIKDDPISQKALSILRSKPNH